MFIKLICICIYIHITYTVSHGRFFNFYVQLLNLYSNCILRENLNTRLAFLQYVVILLLLHIKNLIPVSSDVNLDGCFTQARCHEINWTSS